MEVRKQEAATEAPPYQSAGPSRTLGPLASIEAYSGAMVVTMGPGHCMRQHMTI